MTNNNTKINSLYEQIKFMSPADGLAFLVKNKQPSALINAVIEQYNYHKKVDSNDLKLLHALENNVNLVGCHVNNIELIQQLGKGGMGEVYLGIDNVLQRKVAVKTIRGSFLKNQEMKERFIREALILSKLNHENICKIHNLIEINDTKFLILEYLEGKSLDELNIENLPYQNKLQIALSLLKGIIVAHRNGIIHRDLKPANIIISKRKAVKILDFGISASIDNPKIQASDDSENRNKSSDNPTPTESLTFSGEILGTLGYMSPEQASGSKITPAADIYSLGMVFHLLFSDCKPHPKHLKDYELLLRAKTGISDSLKNVQKDLSTLINRMKSANPIERPTAVDTLALLENIIEKPKKRIKKIILFTVISLTLLGFTKYTYDLKTQKEKTEVAREESDQIADFLQSLFLYSDPYEKNGKDITVRQILEEGAKKIDVELSNQPKRLVKLHQIIAKVYANLGLYDTALQYLNKSVQLYKNNNFDQPEQLMDILAAQAEFNFALSKYQETKNILTRVFAIASKHSFENKLNFLYAKHISAVLKSKEGKYTQALAEYQTILQSYKQQDKPVSAIKQAELYSSIGLAYWNQDKNQKAKENMLQSLSLIKEKSAQALKLEIIVKGNLSLILADLKEYSEAKNYGQSVINMRKKLLGEKHPDLALAYDNLSFIYYRAKEFDKCIALNTKALKIYANSLGKNTTDYALTLANRATLLKKNKQYAQSEKTYFEVIALYDDILGSNNHFSAKEYYLLAQLSLLQKHLQKAQSFLQKSISIYGTIQPTQADAEIKTWEQYISISKKIEDTAKLKTIYQQYLARLKHIKPNDSKTINNISQQLSEL